MGDLIGITPWDCKEKQKLYYLVILERVQPFLEEALTQPRPVACVKVLFAVSHFRSLDKMRMTNVAFVLEPAYYDRRSNIYLSRKCLNSCSALEVPTIHK